MDEQFLLSKPSPGRPTVFSMQMCKYRHSMWDIPQFFEMCINENVLFTTTKNNQSFSGCSVRAVTVVASLHDLKKSLLLLLLLLKRL